MRNSQKCALKNVFVVASLIVMLLGVSIFSGNSINLEFFFVAAFVSILLGVLIGIFLPRIFIMSGEISKWKYISNDFYQIIEYIPERRIAILRWVNQGKDYDELCAVSDFPVELFPFNQPRVGQLFYKLKDGKIKFVRE